MRGRRGGSFPENRGDGKKIGVAVKRPAMKQNNLGREEAEKCGNWAYEWGCGVERVLE